MKRPATALVFGLFNLLWSLLGLLSLLTFVVMHQKDSPLARGLVENGGLAAWLNTATVLNILLSLVLFVSGVGLLMVKPWARPLTAGLGTVQVAINVIGFTIQAFFLAPALFRKLPTMDQEGGPVAATLFFSIAATLFGISYAVLLIVFMKRPSMVTAFSTNPPGLIARPE